jgi:hypothetical protein
VGLANYYSKFVLRFSALAAPLTALCSPLAMFSWGPAEETRFDLLTGKAALISAPVLRVWDRERPTSLLTDASEPSELAVSAILEQPDDTGAYHPVAFESRKLTLPERPTRHTSWSCWRWSTPSRTRTQMKMLRGVQNERFTFEIDTEKALVGCTLEH